MEQVWWYANGNKKIGPITLDDLLQRLIGNQINLEALVWKQGLGNWSKLTDIDEIRFQVLEAIKVQQAKIPPPLPSSASEPPPVPSQPSPQPLIITADTEAPANGSVAYAGFWRRFAAAWLDALVLIPAYIPYWIISAAKGQDHPATLVGILIVLIVSAIYFTRMESGESGASYGKRWVGVKVLDIEGKRISMGRAFTRWISHLLSYITLYIGFFMQPFTARKQALHDLVAGTVIVQTEKAKSTSKIVMAIPVVFVVIFIAGVIAAIAIPAAHRDYTTKGELSKFGDPLIDTAKPKFVDLGTFTVELLPEKGGTSRYLQVSIALKLKEPVLEQIIIASRPEILSKINMLLQSKRPSELATLDGKERLANDINAQIEKVFGVSGVSDVLFTSFTMQ